MARQSCPACGALLDPARRPSNGAVVCPKCGRKLRVSNPAAPPKEPAPLVDVSRYRRGAAGKSRLPLLLGAVGGAAILIVGLVVGFVVLGPKHAEPPAAPKEPLVQAPPPKPNPDTTDKPETTDPPKPPVVPMDPKPPATPPAEPPPPMAPPADAPPPEPDAWKEAALGDVPADLASKALDRINEIRKSAGAAPLTADADASAACADHAAYLARNAGRIAGLGLNFHAEEADLPGRSDAGSKAAPSALIAAKEPLAALDSWANLPAHHALIVRPELKTVGVGFAHNVKDQWASVFEWLGAAPIAGGEGVLYPGDGQTRVGLFFPGAEVPDPLPQLSSKAASGFPITITFPARAQVKTVEASLEDEAGTPVDAWISSPEKPANPAAAVAQQNSICIIARAPLRPGARYAVQVQARVDGKEWRREWGFLTAGADDLRHDFEDRFLGPINAARQKNGLEPIVLEPVTSAACAAHARYVSLNAPVHPDLNIHDETPDWPGATAEGKKIAAGCLCRLGSGPAEQWADWLLGALGTRQLYLEPKVKRIGLGSSWVGAAAGCWVLSVPTPEEWSENAVPILYPYPDQQAVGISYTGDASSIRPDGQDKPAGCPVTVRFSWHKPLEKVTAKLADAAGQEVPTWLSSPQKPLPGVDLGVVCLLPQLPLKEGETYTATVAALYDGKPWTKTWSFTTKKPADADPAALEAAVLADLNKVRKDAGLKPVEMDAALSRTCRAEAQDLVAKNTRPAKEVLLALGVADPSTAVADCVPTFYHRIPLLAPELRRVGFGCARYPNGTYATVLDVMSGK